MSRPPLPERTRAPLLGPGRARAPAVPAPLSRARAGGARLGGEPDARRRRGRRRAARRGRGRARGARRRQPVLPRGGAARPRGAGRAAPRERPLRARRRRRRARHPRARPGDAAGPPRPSRSRYAGGPQRRGRGRPHLRPAAARARGTAREPPFRPCRSCSASSSSSRSGGARPRSTASATASSRRSPTRRSLEQRRRELHGSVGRALEELHRDSPERGLRPARQALQRGRRGGAGGRVPAQGRRCSAGRLRQRAGAGALRGGARLHAPHRRRADGAEDALQDRADAPPRLRLPVGLPRVGGGALVRGRAAAARADGAPPAPVRPGLGLRPGLRVLLTRDAGSSSTSSVGSSVSTTSSTSSPTSPQELTVSADGRTYRFRLEPDARWSDGVPVTADDFVYGWRRTREERLDSGWWLEEVEAANALDDRTLEVKVREPRNYFPYLLAGPWTFPWPRHRCEALGDGWRDPAASSATGRSSWPSSTASAHSSSRARPGRGRGETSAASRSRSSRRTRTRSRPGEPATPTWPLCRTHASLEHRAGDRRRGRERAPNRIHRLSDRPTPLRQRARPKGVLACRRPRPPARRRLLGRAAGRARGLSAAGDAGPFAPNLAALRPGTRQAPARRSGLPRRRGFARDRARDP